MKEEYHRIYAMKSIGYLEKREARVRGRRKSGGVEEGSSKTKSVCHLKPIRHPLIFKTSKNENTHNIQKVEIRDSHQPS